MIKPTISDLYTLDKGGDANSRIIKAVTPISMNIMVPKADDGSYSVLARITWLCKDMTDKLFCLTATYAAEDEADEEFLVSSPLLADRYYANYSLTADLLMSSLDHFLTDLNFEFKFPKEIHQTNETEIYCQAFDKAEDGDEKNDKLHKIMVSPEVYSTLTFVDNYMLDGILNNADLYSALVFGADEANNTYIFEADRLEVEDVALVKSKGVRSKSLAVKLKLAHKDTELELLCLVGLDKGKKILNRDIKKNTFDNLTKDYMVGNNDQYIQRFTFQDTIDKDQEMEYMFIKAVNVRKDGVLFALSKDLQQELISKVDILLNK